MQNQCVSRSRDGFVHYLVTSIICRGYWFYVTGRIPDDKAPELIDEKLIAKYEAGIAKSTRWRRKKLGKANIRYLRWGRFFVIFATKGEHPFFTEEANIRDIRKIPLKVGGYSISFRRDGRPRSGRGEQFRVHVRIEAERYKELLAEFEHYACRMSPDRLAAKLYELPFQGYAPVRRQLCSILRVINRRRCRAGMSVIPKESLFFHRARTSEGDGLATEVKPKTRVVT